jgi:hypothetical protein
MGSSARQSCSVHATVGSGEKEPAPSAVGRKLSWGWLLAVGAGPEQDERVHCGLDDAGRHGELLGVRRMAGWCVPEQIQTSTRSTAARIGPGSDRNATNKHARCPSDAARGRTLSDERWPRQVDSFADCLREVRIGDANLLAELDELPVGQTWAALGGLVFEQRPGVLVEHSSIRGRRRGSGRPGRVPGGRYRVEEVHRVPDEADDPVVQQFVQGRPGHQLELLAKWALEVDICLDVHRSRGVGTVRDGHW